MSFADHPTARIPSVYLCVLGPLTRLGGEGRSAARTTRRSRKSRSDAVPALWRRHPPRSAKPARRTAHAEDVRRYLPLV